MTRMTPTIVQPKPKYLLLGTSIPMMNNLINLVIDLYQLDDRAEFVDRPHLFDQIGWRLSAIEEFDHLGPRDEVHRALRCLADSEIIDFTVSKLETDTFMLRFRTDNLVKLIKRLQKEGAI